MVNLIEKRHLASLLVVVLIGFLIAPGLAQAHRDDYIDETLVFQTLEHGEVELEYGVDYGDRPDPDDKFVRHTIAAEYGLTDQFMVNGKLLLESEFESALVEFRYRFYGEGEKLVDIAISGEFHLETVENSSDDYEFEPRLILSKDLKKFNFTINLPLNIPLKTAPVSFIPAGGLRYGFEENIKIGAEIKYNTHKKEGSLIPQIWFELPEETLLKLGYSQAFDKNTESFLRVFIEKEF